MISPTHPKSAHNGYADISSVNGLAARAQSSEAKGFSFLVSEHLSAVHDHVQEILR